MNPNKFLYRFKIIMIGDNNVGKSCMLYRYVHGNYPESMGVTIGCSFSNHVLEVEPGVRVNIHIVDTAGHESYWKITCRYLPQTAGCLLVFDLCNYTTFTHIKHRYAEVKKTVHPYTVLFVLVGHKCDRKEREVNREEAEQFASELGAPYVEVSSRTGHNVAEVFELLTRRIYQGCLSGEVRLHERWGKIHEDKPAENKITKNEPAENNKCRVS
ncbi:ras-related protein Rab-39B isoform X2 [Puntigrus tetrazona]|nr:ras-related protein Rab-39B isoform X2 [Puntigrus tetrazona]